MSVKLTMNIIEFLGIAVLLVILFFLMPGIIFFGAITYVLGIFIYLLGIVVYAALAVLAAVLAAIGAGVVALGLAIAAIGFAASAIGWLVSSVWNALTPSAISINGQQGLVLFLSVFILIEVFKAYKAREQAKKTDDPKVSKS